MHAHCQVYENESDKAQVHKNPLAFYKPNLHVRGAGARQLVVAAVCNTACSLN